MCEGLHFDFDTLAKKEEYTKPVLFQDFRKIIWYICLNGPIKSHKRKPATNGITDVVFVIQEMKLMPCQMHEILFLNVICHHLLLIVKENNLKEVLSTYFP